MNKGDLCCHVGGKSLDWGSSCRERIQDVSLKLIGFLDGLDVKKNEEIKDDSPVLSKD